MFDKELFKKICDVSCEWGELEKFVIHIDKKEFDLDNAFDKYYKAENIIHAIEKYQAKEIDAKFLAYWANAYDWIIMSGFKIESDDRSVSLKDVLFFELSDWLDSLSFLDDGEDLNKSEEYKNVFKVLDYFLQDIDDCEAVFALDADEDDEDYIGYAHYADVLIRNDNAKYFIKIYLDSYYFDDNVLFPRVSPEELENQATRLQNQGYRELSYDICADDEE